MQEDSQTLNWLPYEPSNARPVDIDIKVESSPLELASFALLSPPSSPLTSVQPDTTVSTVTPTARSPSATRKRSNSSTLSIPKRTKSYHTSSRGSRVGAGDSSMAGQASYSWSSSSPMKGGGSRTPYSQEHSVPARRSSDGDQQAPSYTLSDAFTPQSYSSRSSTRDARPQSSSSAMTSSLTGAMGDTHLSSQSQLSDSPSPSSDQFRMEMQTSTGWQTGHSHASSPHTSYPSGVPGQVGGGVQYNTMPSVGTAPYLQYQGYNHPQYTNASPEMPPSSPGFASTSQQFAFQSGRPMSAQTRTGMASAADPYSGGGMGAQSSPSARRPERVHEEVIHLRKTVRDLELINESARRRIRELEAEVARDATTSSGYVPSSSAMGGLPSPMSTPSPQSASFQAAWRARTEARIRQFCSLNRAGNALCAWHDSRRERRAHPPRMAPPGHLNCGCTYEEALFEESLARHAVGSYHPGETVRMDPALRNPLLKLLEQRYGYKDGDFERDPVTGNWIEGEGPAYWEHRALSGGTNPRSRRLESERH